MKVIDSFDAALDYVLHLGFAGAGPIVHKQASLCDTTDRLLKASGNESWSHETFKPFQVRFHNYRSEGFCYPALGNFDVIRIDGTKVNINAS